MPALRDMCKESPHVSRVSRRSRAHARRRAQSFSLMLIRTPRHAHPRSRLRPTRSGSLDARLRTRGHGARPCIRAAVATAHQAREITAEPRVTGHRPGPRLGRVARPRGTATGPLRAAWTRYATEEASQPSARSRTPWSLRQSRAARQLAQLARGIADPDRAMTRGLHDKKEPHPNSAALLSLCVTWGSRRRRCSRSPWAPCPGQRAGGTPGHPWCRRRGCPSYPDRGRSRAGSKRWRSGRTSC